MKLEVLQNYTERQSSTKKNQLFSIFEADFAQLQTHRKSEQKKYEMGILAINKFCKVKDKYQKQETFHQIIRNFLIIGQCFGAMPVQGITSSSAGSLKFSFCYIGMFFSILIVAASFFMALVNLYWVLVTEIKFDKIGPFIWYSSNTFVIYSFISLAKRWPSLMQFWEYVEKEVAIIDPKYHSQMKRLIKFATFGIPALSLTENLLSIAFGVQKAQKCTNVSAILEAYFHLSHPGYYSAFNYNIISGILLQLLNFATTFLWNFTDNFITIVSFGLTAQFQHFNHHFNKFKGKSMRDEFWGKQREYFNTLAELLHKVDENFAIIIMVAFANNLYYICLQLFNSVAANDSIVRAVYFWFSLFFLIGRTLLVSYSAARINDESKKPAIVIRLVPSAVYSTEAKRFLETITNCKLALSGMNFFHLTRKFILNVAGTVVTYELVLVQLQREPSSSEDPCSH